MVQYEQFSDKAKQIIELVKNCENKKNDEYKNHFYENHNEKMIYYSCSLSNIQNEFDQIIKFCKSKNYWMDSK